MELRRQLEKFKLNVLVLLSITIKLTSRSYNYIAIAAGPYRRHHKICLYSGIGEGTGIGLGENLSVKITPSPDPQLETVCTGRKIVLTCDTNSPAGPFGQKIDCAWTFGDVQYENIEGNTCTVDDVVKTIPVTYNCTCVATDLHVNLGSTAINISANGK